MALFDKSKLQKTTPAPAEHKPLIMIVDDEPANLAVLSELLEEKFEVVTAFNGKEALDKINAMSQPSALKAVIADQRMPIMCGTELLEDVLHIAPQVVRILVTGYSDIDSIMDSINKAQIYRYIAKPYNRQDLLLTVVRAVESLELKEAKQRAEEDAKKHLQQVNEALSSANNLKTLFLATVSHELRTPMHGVVGNLELLNTTSMSEDSKSYLCEARDSALQMRSMLDDILLYTEIQSGGHSLACNKFSLHALIEDVANNARRACELKNLRFVCVVDGAVPANVRTDKMLFAQILRHLLSNAVKFTDYGEIRLLVKLGEASENVANKVAPETLDSVTGKKINLCLQIQDTGIGISEEEQSQLFESFNQLNKKFNRRYGGLGLGLALSKQIAGLFGGELRVESAPGKGSCFTVLLPMVGQPAGENASVQQFGGFDTLQRQHVLVVDDNAVNRKVIEAMLKRLGCKATSVVNGLEAVQTVENGMFDMILMDCQMPVMDGFEATVAIKSNPRHLNTPIIAFTANAAQRDREHASESGMCDLLQKPVTLQQLSDCLLKWAPRKTVQ